jgi:hypothetical protein
MTFPLERQLREQRQEVKREHETWFLEGEEHLHFNGDVYENWMETCRNPSLGLITKARVYKNAGQDGGWESVRMNTHTPKRTPMLGIGVPLDSQIFRE